MILVTIGTNEQPFDRLVRAAANLYVDEPLLVQHGSSHVPHGMGEWVDFMPFDALAQRASEARVVVCHAGVGSIMLARRCGHTPVVVPRRQHLGEAVDDHQVVLARRLSSAGLVTLVEDAGALADAVRRSSAIERVPAREELSGAAALSAEVRSVLADLGVAQVSERRTNQLSPSTSRPRRWPRTLFGSARSRRPAPEALSMGLGASQRDRMDPAGRAALAQPLDANGDLARRREPDPQPHAGRTTPAR